MSDTFGIPPIPQLFKSFNKITQRLYGIGTIFNGAEINLEQLNAWHKDLKGAQLILAVLVEEAETEIAAHIPDEILSGLKELPLVKPEEVSEENKPKEIEVIKDEPK